MKVEITNKELILEGLTALEIYPGIFNTDLIPEKAQKYLMTFITVFRDGCVAILKDFIKFDVKLEFQSNNKMTDIIKVKLGYKI